MPKFLLTLIFSLIILGQIFAVKDYTPVETEDDLVHLEDLYFDEKYVDMKEPIQIIKVPNMDEQVVINDEKFDKNEKNCVYFNYKGIPYVDVCINQEEQEIFSTDF